MILLYVARFLLFSIKFAEKKQKKKNAGQQKDESVVNSSNNPPVDDSQKALTGDVLFLRVCYILQKKLLASNFALLFV